jgi:hypothetical protein
MAVLTSNVPTLVDVAKRLDPDGKVAKIAELLDLTNPILQDMPFFEGNLPTGTRTTVRTGLPTVAWRLINKGVPPSKSTTAQIDEQCGMLEAYSEVDVELAKLNGNTAEFRLSEATAFLEAMNQEMASTLFYGNSGTSPEKFTGLAPRFSSLTAQNGQNIINAAGTTLDSASIWLIVWGPNTVHGIYPKGSEAGLQHKDLGEVTVDTTAGIGGSRMQAYRDHWQWKCGIALRDWRYVVRVANIDLTDTIANTTTSPIITFMIKAMHRVPSLNMGKPVFYMNRSIAQYLDIQTQTRATNTVQSGNDAAGRPMLSFRGIPIRTVDAILDTEVAVA